MPKSTITKAVIYCRVSSAKQVRDGNGLASQETRCREYAHYRNYQIVQVFADDITGKHINRPAMSELLVFLRQHKKSGDHVVIIDDISRFARNLRAHLELRTTLAAAGGKLESPSIEFGEDSDSLLVENILASAAQHQREKNAEQTKNRMRAWMMSGYWVFPAPLGYHFEKQPGNGNVLIRSEPVAAIITEALEGYASGRFESRVELKRFLESKPDFPKSNRGEVTFRIIDWILTRPIYAGFITRKDWGLNLIEGKHEPLISYETYLAIQNRSNTLAKAPARKDLNEDFPLRGFVTCGCCDEPMTSCWSKGRNQKYPYYMCFNKGCEANRKSIRRDVMEKEFVALLATLTPSEELFCMSFDMFRDMWENNLATTKNRQTSMRREITQIEKKVEQFLERIVDTNNNTLIKTYEKKLDDLESRKLLLSEKINNYGRATGDFKVVFRTAFDFLQNPQKLWASNRFEDKRAVLKLVFAERLPYHRNEGFRTAKTTLPFKVLGDISGPKNPMAERMGFEPTIRVNVYSLSRGAPSATRPPLRRRV